MRRLLNGLAALLMLALPAAAAAQDDFVDSNGVRIRYLDRGKGEPVVLLHGYTSSLERSWVDTGVLANLAADHRVIALDVRGHGQSGKPHDVTAYGERMGQDVLRVLDHLGISRAHIVGYSMGAIITAKLLTTNPDRFATATLGGHSGVRRWSPENERDAEAWAVELESGTPFRGLILATAPADQPPPGEDAIRQRSSELAALNDRAALAAYNRSRGAFVTTSAQMMAVRVPTQGVIGSADALLAGMRELKAMWPALRVIIVDGATHGGERGALRRREFVDAVREFIAAHASSPSS